jgi:tyrosinase
MSGAPNFPVANPTWYDTIRFMFNSTDIAHMKGMDIDLSSYDTVVVMSSAILGQVASKGMPRPPSQPWTPDMVTTFINWMTNKFPKGTPSPAQVTEAHAFMAAKAQAPRLRKDVTTLSADEQTKLKNAFNGILQRDVGDPNGYFALAGIHWNPAPFYCMHHAPGYNPWHRAYMFHFENALRSVPGCEDVTLPYWDITTPIPNILKAAPFGSYTLPQDIGDGYDKGLQTSRFDEATIAAKLVQYGVTGNIAEAFEQPDWTDFHGYWSDAPNDTIIAAHDGGHGSIGTTMADQSIAAFDPVFWFFHANWDRLWWEWQVKVGGTNLNGLLTTINQATDPGSYLLFTNATAGWLPPFTDLPFAADAVKMIDSVGSLGVDYAPPATPSPPTDFAVKTNREVSIARSASVDAQRALVSVTGVNRLNVPGSFSVHLLKDGKRIASRFMFQPSQPKKCETCAKTGAAHFEFRLPLDQIAGGKLDVEIEPVNKNFVGDVIPAKMLGEPKISVHIPLRTE